MTRCFRLLNLLLLILLLLLLPASAPLFARGTAQGWCQQGNQQVITPGTGNSTTRVQRSYPSCTVTVYQAGTVTLASIYSDNSGTVLTNPFTAQSTGQWRLFADNGPYDVKLSGSGISSPFTLSSITVIDSSIAVTSVTGTSGVNCSPTTGAVICAVGQAVGPTASPTFAGMTVSQNTSGNLVSITQAGAGNALVTSGVTTMSSASSMVIPLTVTNVSSLGTALKLAQGGLLISSGFLTVVSGASAFQGGATVTGGLVLTGSSAASTNGTTFAGTHIQNLGSGDSPTFSSVTVGSCTGCGSLTAPVTISGSSSGDILTVTQSGAGNAIVATGPSTMTKAGGIALTLSSAGGTALSVTSGAVLLAGALTVSGAGVLNGGLQVAGGFTSTGSSTAAFSANTFTGTHIQNTGAGDTPVFTNVNVSGVFQAGLSSGITGATCSSFKAGICIAP